MARRTMTPSGCRYGHGPDRVAETPDGLHRCRTCANNAAVLRRARETLPDLPGLHDFMAAHGQEAIDRLRLALRKPASSALGPDGRYRYARPGRYHSLNEELAWRSAENLAGGYVR